MAILIIEKTQIPELQNKVFPLLENGEPNFIGRDEGTSIGIQDGLSSRRHAKLYLRFGNWILEDLDSRNGTIYKGERIEKTPLLTEDVFQIGSTLLHLVSTQAYDAFKEREVSGCHIDSMLGQQGQVLSYRGKQLAMDREVQVDLYSPQWHPFEEEKHASALSDGLDEALKAAQDLAHPQIAALLSHQCPDPKGSGLTIHKLRGENLLSSRLGNLLESSLGHRLSFLSRLAEAILERGTVKALNLPLSLDSIGVDSRGLPVIPAFDLAAWTSLRTGALLHEPNRLAYLPPEIISVMAKGGTAPSALPPASIAYNFGCIAYELLTGKKVMGEGRGDKILKNHLQLKPKSLHLEVPEISDSLASAIEGLLQKKPGERLSLEDALETFSNQEAEYSSDAQAPQAKTESENRRPRSPRPSNGRTAPASSNNEPLVAAESTPGWLFLPVWLGVWTGLFFGARFLTNYILQELAKNGS